MTAKGFILQKLQHSRCQSLRNTVDFIDKQNPFLLSRPFHAFINRCNDLTQCVFRHTIFSSLIFPAHNMRKPNGTLPGMMSDRICHQSHLAGFCRLFHDCRLSDSRRSDQQNRPLPDQRILITSSLILSVISQNCTYNLFFCLFYIHSRSSLCSAWSLSVCSPVSKHSAHWGTRFIQGVFFVNTKAVS